MKILQSRVFGGESFEPMTFCLAGFSGTACPSTDKLSPKPAADEAYLVCGH
jgi:hypothetical protein